MPTFSQNELMASDPLFNHCLPQSEEEVTLNLPPTIFMNRNQPEKLPAIQVSFIQHLVYPLFTACAEAGIIPGILESEPARTSTPSADGKPPSADSNQGKCDFF